MSIDRVRAYLKPYGLDGRVRQFSTSSATVGLAAQAIGCAPERIAKTLSFKLGDCGMLVVVAGDARVDNARFKARFHSRAKMLSADEVQTLIGHSIGGVCPFGVKKGVQVYLDVSLKRFETVYPACGSDNSAIELGMAELEACSGSLGWVDVCKDWQGSGATQSPWADSRGEV